MSDPMKLPPPEANKSETSKPEASKPVTREVIRFFAADLPSLTAAELTGLNYRTVHRIYSPMRERLVEMTFQEMQPFAGDIEVDESYFGARRVRGKRGRGAGGKNHVNGIESFWSFAKHRLLKLRSIRTEKFLTHLKECEWRWNHRHRKIYPILLKHLRQYPLSIT